MKRWTAFLALLTGLIWSGLSPAADFNGDGTNDIGIFRPASGLWAVRGITRAYFGSSADTPLPGDYNGNGEAEIAIFRPASGLWAVKNLTRVYFGQSGDEPLPAGGGGALWDRNGSDIYYTGGNVGIGISNPAYLLHIKENFHGKWIVGIHNTGIIANDYGLVVRADGGDPLLVQTNGGTSALRVEQDGDVGIGINDPAYKLDVNGDIRATGSVYYGGTAGYHDGTPYSKPDFVFEGSYRALTIDEVEEYLKREKCLPWMTPNREEKSGIVNMTRMSFETVETSENLQLQVITLNKLIKAQQKAIDGQNKRIKALENRLALSD